MNETNRGLLNIQYGAGWSPGDGWLNYDGSPTVWLERLPLVGKLLRVNSARFPSSVLYGDIITGLPVQMESAKAVYASHVLEHLSYQDCLAALRNTYAMLSPGGVFRLVVPDLSARVDLYLAARMRGEPEAANDLCRTTMFGISERPPSTLGKLRSAFGNSNHLWMWDEASMTAALRMTGFVRIRRCEFGDAADPDFAQVEARDRFHDMTLDISELALEAHKPS